MGLCAHRLRQRRADKEPSAAHRRHHNHRWHRLGNGRLRGHYQRGYERKGVHHAPVALSRPRHRRSGADAFRASAVYRLSGFRRTVPQRGGIHSRQCQPCQRYECTRSYPQHRRISAACRERRFRSGSPHPCGIRQHPVRSRDDAYVADQRTRTGTRTFRLSSQPAARCRTDND